MAHETTDPLWNETTDLLWDALDRYIEDRYACRDEDAQDEDNIAGLDKQIADAEQLQERLTGCDMPERARALVQSIDPVQAVRTVVRLAALLGAHAEWSYDLLDEIGVELSELLPAGHRINTDGAATRAEWMRVENDLANGAAWDVKEIAEVEGE